MKERKLHPHSQGRSRPDRLVSKDSRDATFEFSHSKIVSGSG